MRLKYIILSIVAFAAVLLGTYNWVNYFKGQAELLPAGQIKALRPVSEAEESPLQQVPDSGGLESGPDVQPAATSESRQSLPQFPDSLGRNPFLTLEEIEAISQGDTLGAAVPAIMPGPAVNIKLPELRLTGLVKDASGGGYRAMINGRTYKRGDTVGIEEIVEITGNSVVLEHAARRRTLTLKPGKEGQAGAATIKVKKNP